MRPHRRQHCDAEHAAELTDCVLRAGGLALFLGRTAARTTFATGAQNIAMPMPETMNGATSSQYGVAGVEIAASDPRPAACSVSPMPMRRAPPSLSDKAPAMGATNMGMIVQGRIRSPEPSGE